MLSSCRTSLQQSSRTCPYFDLHALINGALAREACKQYYPAGLRTVQHHACCFDSDTQATLLGVA